MKKCFSIFSKVQMGPRKLSLVGATSSIDQDEQSNNLIRKQQQLAQNQARRQIQDQRVETDLMRIKIYYSFDHSTFQNREDLIESLILEFNRELDKITKSVYLTLTLKEIELSKNWNNFLVLKDNCNENYLNNSFGNENADENLNETINTVRNQGVQGNLSCNCVWSILFKLHRLQQTISKDKQPNAQISLPQQKSGSQKMVQSPAQQLHVSEGLIKLRETLHNFKIFEAACDDLYFYTTNKNEIFLLKLEEVYDGHHNTPQSILINESNPLTLGNEMPSELSVSLAGKSIGQTKMTQLSRRPSYASINDSEVKNITAAATATSSSGMINRLHNLSGGSMSSNVNVSQSSAPPAQNTSGLNNTLIAGSVIGGSSLSVSQRLNPDYIKLKVYGLNEPDERMKNELCRKLQSALDHLLLFKMCNSIEKNTYKTTSAQHPDKITDEDISFIKQISENYFDYELPLPFAFNFNRTMRESFCFFIRQIFNCNFKVRETIKC